MTLRARVDRLRRAARDRPRPGELHLIVCMPPDDSGLACDQQPGVYFNSSGSGVTVVFDGLKPDPAVLDPLRARLAPWGMIIVGDPDEVPPPLAPDD